MMLLKTIDGLFVGTRYGAWGLGVLGIVGSIILVLANFTNGLASMMLFVAALSLSLGVSLILLPKWFIKGDLLQSKRFIIGGVAITIAAIVAGAIYFINGGFPPINLLFV